MWTHFRDYPDTFRIIRKLSRLSSNIPRSSRLFFDYPDTFSRLSVHFLHCPETSSSSRHFLDHLDTFRLIRTLCILSICILCIASGHFPSCPEILQPIMNLSQKLSGFAKTFLVSLTLSDSHDPLGPPDPPNQSD